MKFSNAQIVTDILEDAGFGAETVATNAVSVWLNRRLGVSEVQTVLDETLDPECIGFKCKPLNGGVLVEVWNVEPAEPTPDPNCPDCRGRGYVSQSVPWGNGGATEGLGCSCVEIREATE